MRIPGTVILTILASSLFASVDYHDLQKSIQRGETETQLKKRIVTEGLDFALNRRLLKQMKRDHFPNWLIDYLVDYEQGRLVSDGTSHEVYPRRYDRITRHDLYMHHLASSYSGWFAPSFHLLSAWCDPFYWNAYWSPWWNYTNSLYRYGMGYGYGRPYRYYDGRGYRRNNRGARVGPNGYRRGQQTGRRAVSRSHGSRSRSSSASSRGRKSSSRGTRSSGTAVRRR